MSDSTPNPANIPAPSADAAPPWVTHPRIVAAIEVLFCSGIPTQLAIASLLVLAGVPARGEGGLPTAGFVIALLLLDTCVVIALMAALMRAHGESPRAIWLGTRPIARETVLGLWLIPAVFLMVGVLIALLRLVAPWLHNVQVNPFEEIAGGSAAGAALFGFAAILAGGVREELQRGFLLNRFERHLGGPAVGVIVLSAGFGIAHVDQGWDAVITTGTLGLVWALMYLRRRSVVAPLVSHAGFNALEVLRVGLVSAWT